MQSTVFDTLMASDASTVVAAPTGSGKTALFELAIIRLLSATPEGAPLRGKTVCLVPLKALCAERAGEWRAKFGPLGVRVAAITGDGGGAPGAALRRAGCAQGPKVSRAGLPAVIVSLLK